MNALRAIALFALVFYFGSANAAFEMTHLQSLVEAGRADEAYAYAEQHLAALEGELQFDYYFGIAAIDSGHASQGVFALERVIAQEPGHHAARLELARGYFLLEEFARARSEFETVLASQPPRPVRDRIERFMDAIRREEGRYRVTATAYVQLGAGFDDNVNAGPPDEIIQEDGVTIATLDDTSVQTEDSFYRLTTGGQANIPFAPGWFSFIGADWAVRGHAEENDYDYSNAELRGGLVLLTDRSRYQLELGAETYIFDGETFRNSTSLTGDWRRRSGERGQWSAFGQVAELRYPEQEIRDSTLMTLGTGYSHVFLGRWAPMLYGSVYFGQESPEDDGEDAERVAERDLSGMRIGAQFSLTSRHLLRTGLNLQRSKYGAEDIQTQKTRADNYQSLNLEWEWRWARLYSLRTSVDYANNASNLELYDYQRSSAEIALHLGFD